MNWEKLNSEEARWKIVSFSCLHFEAASYLPLLLATAEVISQITHRTHLFLKWIELFGDGPCHQPSFLPIAWWWQFFYKVAKIHHKCEDHSSHHTGLVTSKHKHLKTLITHYCRRMATNFERTQLSYTVYILFEDWDVDATLQVFISVSSKENLAYISSCVLKQGS